jgi:hypothetical protein
MTAISASDVSKAKLELDRMRSSLSDWLRFRAMNDKVIAGQVKTNKPLSYARVVIEQNRDTAVEQKLASQLSVLLAECFPSARLPNPDLTVNPNAAVQLAQIAVSGNPPAALAAPESQGMTWLWPVLITGGLLLAVTTAIKTTADVAKQREEIACIEAGACTDYGFWIKAASIATLAYLAVHLGALDTIKDVFKRKRL